MTARRHDKDGFYKYCTADVAKLVLANGTRKWSTPALFNDPFDNQFSLVFEEPSRELARTNMERFHELLSSPEPLTPDQFGTLTPELEELRAIFQTYPNLRHTEEEWNALIETDFASMQRLYEDSPAVDAGVREVMADTSILCLSEERNNILLWSHYALNHTGVSIKFLALTAVDSPLLVAEPVSYTRELPRLRYSPLWNSNRVARLEWRNTITLTKSEVWSYEREWRIVATLRDKTKDHEILPFAPEEVGEVYLGCRISHQDREDIIRIVRQTYPAAQIFQAMKAPREFALVFEKV